MIESYETITYANSMHKHGKSGRGSQEVKWKSTALQPEKWKEIGCQCRLQRRRAVVRKDFAMKDLHCREFEGISESIENVNSEIEPPVTGKGGGNGRTKFAGERVHVKREPDHCEPVCRRELHLPPSDWKQHRGLRPRAKSGTICSPMLWWY